MTTFRVGTRARFVVVVKDTVNDSRLSFKALGLLVWLLDKPDDWRVDARSIAHERVEGRGAILGMLRELDKYGYLQRERRQGNGGLWRTFTNILERPGLLEAPVPAPRQDPLIVEVPEAPIDEACLVVAMETTQLEGRKGIRDLRAYSRPRAAEIQQRHGKELSTLLREGATMEELLTHLRVAEEAYRANQGLRVADPPRPRLPEFKQDDFGDTKEWQSMQPTDITAKLAEARGALGATKPEEPGAAASC